MENKLCLDTDFLVNFLRDKKAEANFITENESKIEFSTTFINMFELYYGAYKSDKKKENLNAIKQLLNRIDLLNLSLEAVEKAGEILAKLEEEGKPIEFRDLLIGTIALSYGYSLKTGNKEHFNRIPSLKII